jgi:hypothetical protein
MRVAEIISYFASIAYDTEHPLRKLARHIIIRDLLWRWTADGVEQKTGVVCADVLKYCRRYHRTSKSAEKARDLRHEHAVPRKLLADRMIEKKMNTEKIFRFLEAFCKVVIITKSEHDKLGRCMPEGWNWRRGSVFARYEAGFGKDWERKFLQSRK